MAEVQANITLVTTGGDQAAEEVNKASVALNSMTAASSGMEGQFQHRFQHIGLMLFAGDALRASGLGRETRMVVSALNLALQEGAVAAGISSGGFLLIVTALVALAGIAYKATAAHKDLAESMEKTMDAQLKQVEATQKDVDTISQYVAQGGAMTRLDKEEYEAKKNLAAAEERSAEITMTLAIPAINQHIIKLQEDKAQMVANALQMDITSELLLRSHIPAFMLLGKVMKDHAEDTDALRVKQAQLDVEINKQISTLRTYERTLVDIRAGNRLTWDEKLKDLQAENTETEKAAKHEEDVYKAMWAKRIADARAFYKEHEKEIDEDSKKVKAATDRMASDFGTMANDMLFRGESFAQAFQQMWQRMAEQVIEWIIKMIAEWAVFTAMTGMGGQAALIGAKGLSSMGFATGGSTIADAPTLAMFGEAGPEVATFTPVGAGSGEGGGGGQVINANITVNANGVNDPQQLARLIGPALIQEIRGQGQLNFTRA